MTQDLCEACRYFRTINPTAGTCHRYPPSFAGDSSPREEHRWRFPIVTVHAWCGEFARLRQDASPDTPPRLAAAAG